MKKAHGVANWTEDRGLLIRQKQQLARALTETMSVRVRLADGSTIDGKLTGETLEGEIASGGRLGYRATLTLYSRESGHTEIDLLGP